jgi:NAD(P)-dependent dehydrogenase (short-subunit alcohol dehydrogenase family)
MRMEMTFANRVALVTGAASGIGRAAAIALAQRGAAVYAIDCNEAGLNELAKTNPTISASPSDVTNHAHLAGIIDNAIAKHGQIDILVNNAGFCHYERLADSTLENWRRTMAINIEAMYVLAKLAGTHMMRRSYGRIINISSTQSLQAEPTVGVYAATKGAINAWSRSLAVDLAEHNVLVNVVAPGCIHTGMSMVNGVDETTTDLFKEWYVKNRKIPLARAGRPEEVADAILFLAGEQCTYITGQTLVVDGGLTITF